MNNFCIWIVSPRGDNRALAYNEVARTLHYGFEALGYVAPVVYNVEDIVGQPIVLGCNLLYKLPKVKVPKDAILFNFEQIYDESPWLTDEYLTLLRNHRVWDYSQLNIARLRKFAVNDIQYCGIGYVPQLSATIPARAEDIDVLMYGMKCDRRSSIIAELKNSGINAVFLNNMYGAERDEYIARTKIVLNVHYYEAHIFEIVRIFYLFANRKFVLSEPGADRLLEEPYGKGIIFSNYDDIVKTCQYYLDNTNARESVSQRGFEIFQAKPHHQFLAAALAV